MNMSCSALVIHICILVVLFAHSMSSKTLDAKHIYHINRYELLKTEEYPLYTRLLVKLPPAPKLKHKKSWVDIAGESFKKTIDSTFENMAGSIAKKVRIQG